MQLKNKKCIPCEGGVPQLSLEEISNLLKKIHSDWEFNDQKIRRKFHFVNYTQTMDFVNATAKVAEYEGHHPVMHIYYGIVILELWTHAIDGLSENDFILAAKLDAI
jgi:4a-hydroxytetrahydrobiopterin dehydratase